MRLSNFLLWQIAYAEIWVTETLWPDFRRRHLLEAVVERMADGVEAAWHVVQPILDTPMSLHEYEPNTWGPREADFLIASPGAEWREPA